MSIIIIIIIIVLIIIIIIIVLNFLSWSLAYQPSLFFFSCLFANIGLVYSQVAYEIMKKKSADTTKGIFSRRNLVPRLILRTLYMAFCGFMAAMLPFFGDINAVVGAFGFMYTTGFCAANASIQHDLYADGKKLHVLDKHDDNCCVYLCGTHGSFLF